MSDRARTESPPPLFLTLIHLLVFGGAACIAVEIAFPEWRQLSGVLFQPFVMGELPRVMPLIGSGGAALLLLALILRVARRRTVPLPLSIGILGFAALTLVPSPTPSQRTWAGVDKIVLGATSRLQRGMVQTLQTHGEVPVSQKAWAQALAAAAESPLPVHAHLRPLTFQLYWLTWTSPLPPARIPGTVVAQVSPDGVAFALNAVGFAEDGQVAYLKDDRGELLTLRGLFNPAHPGGGGTPPGAGLPSSGF